MKLTVPGVGIAVPAQPADFQAEAESDTRIQLSWLLPPQERITKYELVYWAAEDEGQQVSPEVRKDGRNVSSSSPWSALGAPGQVPAPGFLPAALWLLQPVWVWSLQHSQARGKVSRVYL